MPSAKALTQQSIVENLRQAQSLIRRGHVLEALDVYQQALKKDMFALFYDEQTLYGWRLIADTSQPSINLICLLLGDYYVQVRAWKEWLQLHDLIQNHPDYHQLPANQRSALAGYRGWSAVHLMYRDTSLIELIQYQQDHLVLSDLTSLNRARHYLVISYLYRIQRRESLAFEHLHKALDCLEADTHPFYQALAQEYTGSTYYYLNNQRMAYYDKAVDIYRTVETFARRYHSDFDFTQQAYNLGWVYVELGQHEKARQEFQRGYDEVKHFDLAYERAKYEYGLGYTKLCLGKPVVALSLLEKALSFFIGESTVMTAICLYIMSEALLEINPHQAEDYAERAIKNLQKAPHPVHLHHARERHVHALWHNKKWLRAFLGYMRLLSLRFRIGFLWHQ